MAIWPRPVIPMPVVAEIMGLLPPGLRLVSIANYILWKIASRKMDFRWSRPLSRTGCTPPPSTFYVDYGQTTAQAALARRRYRRWPCWYLAVQGRWGNWLRPSRCDRQP